MGRTCFVPLCKTGYRSQKNERISLFRVPQNKIAEWQRIIPREDRALSVNDNICEKHFLKEYITRKVNNELFSYALSHPKLTKDAIPTVFPSCPSLNREIKKRRLVQKHEILETKKIKSEQITHDISIQNEYEAKVAVQNSSEVFEFKDDFEFKDNFEFKNDIEFKDNFEFKDDIEFKDDLEFKDNLEIKGHLEFKDDLEFKDNFEFKDNLPDTIFSQILENISIIMLPSEEWAIHKYVKGMKGDLICFSEMFPIEDNNMIVRKKLVLSKDAIKIFVFDHMINSNVIFSNKCVNTIAELQNGLNKFNNLSVCYGGLPIEDVPSNFKNSLYLKDHHLNVWRHVACSYILSTVTNEKKLEKNQGSTCSHCNKNRRAITNFKYHLTRSANKISRIQKALKNAGNLQKREKRLKLKNQEIMEKLKYAHKKIKELDEGLSNKISTLDMSASQKLLLQECIDICKYNGKTSRRYNSK